MESNRLQQRQRLQSWQPSSEGKLAKLDKVQKFVNKLKHMDSVYTAPDLILKQESSLNLSQHFQQVCYFLVKNKKPSREVMNLYLQLAVRMARQYSQSQKLIFDSLSDSTQIQNALFACQLIVIFDQPATVLRKILNKQISSCPIIYLLQSITQLVANYGPQFFKIGKYQGQQYTVDQSEYVKIYQTVWQISQKGNQQVQDKYRQLQKFNLKMQRLKEKKTLSQATIEEWNKLCVQFQTLSGLNSYLSSIINSGTPALTKPPPVKSEESIPVSKEVQIDQEQQLYHNVIDLKIKVPETALKTEGLGAKGAGFLNIEELPKKLSELTNYLQADNLGGDMALILNENLKDEYVQMVGKMKPVNKFAIRTIALLSRYWPQVAEKIAEFGLKAFQKQQSVENAQFLSHLACFGLLKQGKLITAMRRVLQREQEGERRVSVVKRLLQRQQYWPELQSDSESRLERVKEQLEQLEKAMQK